MDVPDQAEPEIVTEQCAELPVMDKVEREEEPRAGKLPTECGDLVVCKLEEPAGVPAEPDHFDPVDLPAIDSGLSIMDASVDGASESCVLPQISMILPLSSYVGDNESSIRSESVNSNSGSCDREATTSPILSRRRSSRLRTERPPTRKSTRRADVEPDEDHLEGSESAEISKPGTSGKRSSKDKSDYNQNIRNVAPERQINPHMDVMWDGFCWRCHKPVPLAEQQGCQSCVRIFHRECWWNDSPFSSKDVMESHPVHAAFGHNLDRDPSGSFPAPQECIECFCVLEEEKKDDNIYIRVGAEKFRKYLQYMMRFVDDHLPPERVRPFAVPVFEQDECSESVKAKYAEYITRPMDLRQIGENINEGKYNTCASFLADLRWIYHNTSIFNGQNNRYTRSAFYIVETCQHLCYSLEWCMECFERGMPAHGESIHEAVERGMITPCSDPHAVVWVKAEKFPIWPAIVYRFNGSVADVRFFGAFEFGVFPKDAIFLFCKAAVTDRRKGRLKLDYENALRQFRLHVSKLRLIPGKELISYPKKTRYDGRLWMFPEGEDANQTVQAMEVENDQEPQTDLADDTEVPVNDEEENSAAVSRSDNKTLELLLMRSREARGAVNGPEKRSRSNSPSDGESARKRRHGESLAPVDLFFSASIDGKTENIRKSGMIETLDGESDTPSTDNGIGNVVGAENSDGLVDVPPNEEADILNIPDLSDQQKSLSILASPSSPKLDEDAGTLPLTPTETVKPAFFESDSDTDVGELPSFEVQEDLEDAPVSKSSGKLDNILKKPPGSAPDQAQAPEEFDSPPAVAPAWNVSLPPQEISKSLPSGSLTGKSVLHDALVRPYQHQSDVFTSMVRRQKAPSMAAGGQSHLIEALRASPRLGSDANQRKIDVSNVVAEADRNDAARRLGREETLGSLLAAGTQRGAFGRTAGGFFSTQPSLSRTDISGLPVTLSGNRQILPKPDNLPVHDVRSGSQDGRRINAVSTQLNLAAARNAQARTSQVAGDGAGASHGHNLPGPESHLQRSILARSLNAPASLVSGRPGGQPTSGPLNGTSQSPRNGVGDLNGDRSSPSALQTAMRNLVSSRATHSPVAQDSLRNTPLVSQIRRSTPPESGIHSLTQSESVQAQIDLFLRNTKKIVRDKREEAAQTMRESSQTHADNLRLLHDAQLKIQQRAEKTIQDLQETMEQNIRKFELLFMVFHSESEFAQKSKILEVSRMKDLERQRAVTAAKRTLWCCVCQKRARMICCGVTMYCSENCHMNNASLHRLHCRRLQSTEEDDGSVYTPYGMLVRCSLLPPGLDDEDDLEAGIADGDAATSGSAGLHNYVGNNGWNHSVASRGSAGPSVELIDVSHDEDNLED